MGDSQTPNGEARPVSPDSASVPGIPDPAGIDPETLAQVPRNAAGRIAATRQWAEELLDKAELDSLSEAMGILESTAQKMPEDRRLVFYGAAASQVIGRVERLLDQLG